MTPDAFDEWCKEQGEFVTEIVEDGAEVVVTEVEDADQDQEDEL